MNARLPWFPMYVSDWLLSHSVRLMTPEQRGIYVQLLCEQWQNGGTLPDDDPQLQILSGATTEQWVRSKDAVLKNFDHHNGMIFNKRLRQEMENRETWQAKLSEAGKRGMAKRWAKDSDSAPSADNGNQSSPEQQQTRRAVEEVWNYFVPTIGKNPKLYSLTEKRLRMGKARLSDLLPRVAEPKIENAVALMKLCVDRLASSPFHNGSNDQHKKYLDWEIIFRSTDQMEKWLDDSKFGVKEA